MNTETFSSVWDAIEDDPAEAEHMKLRSTLMMALDREITARGWTQAEAARQLGVTQPRISDLLRGKIERFSLDMLVRMVGAAGLHVEMHVQSAA
jgi:predicted XRE-type DNA-binding protein